MFRIIYALPFLYPCSLEHVEGARNKVAEEIAVSVTRDHRCQSYVASGGPRWLLNRLESEARRAMGNADGLDFDRKCVRLLGCTGRRCICCNNAPEILKCYDTQAACMAHCTNPTI
ncbi:hypothetical protein HID58_075515 [Brassica napus]|uniref:RNase H type-1 domain-containing protein n=1 Tax=Brassica napus TaxID=3708 RepID=A0ABQ7YK56_BRANA|nr:hypothetical protein HID58_075515 [Brassica napus]